MPSRCARPLLHSVHIDENASRLFVLHPRSRRKWLHTAIVGGCIVLAAAAASAVAQDAATDPSAQATLDPITLGKVFTFLLLSLGPFNIVGPFAEMTRGRDRAFKRHLALQGTLVAALAVFVSATFGVTTLTGWGVSAAALFITVGILLFLVAVRVVLAQYKPRELQPESPRVDTASAPTVSALAFSPLAFPTIVTPYGIAVLTLAMTLPSDGAPSAWQILAVAVVVLAVDFLAMLGAEHLLKAPLSAAVFGIVGSVMAVLQIALSIQAVIAGLRLLGLVAAPGA